jgi:hypothetical protein
MTFHRQAVKSVSVGYVRFLVLVCAAVSLGLVQLAASAPVVAASLPTQNKLSYIKAASIESIKGVSGNLRHVQLTFDEGCGESLRGLLVDETKTGIYVAAVLDRSDTYCLSLPKKRMVTLKVSGQKEFKTLTVDDVERVNLTDVSDVTISSGSISVAWQDTCRPYVGVVLSPVLGADGAPKMNLMVANLPKAGMSKTTLKQCARQTTHKRLTSISLADGSLMAAPKPGKLESLFSLRIIAPEQVTISEDRALAITWMGTCRDVPLAAFFGGKDGREVAIVTVFAPNAPCAYKGKRSSVFTLQHFQVAGARSLEAMTPEVARTFVASSGASLTLRSISAMKIARLGHGDWLLASPSAGCGESFGLMVGADAAGNASMAILSAGSQKICRVDHAKTSATLTAPLVARADGPIPKIFSLKVQGTSIQ